MRILHVLHPWQPRDPLRPLRPPSSAGDVEIALARLVTRHLPEHEHTVLLVGGAGAAARARAMGLRHADRLAPALSTPRLAAHSLSSFLTARRPFDLIQFYGRSLRPLAPAASEHAHVFEVDTVEGTAWRLQARIGWKRYIRLDGSLGPRHPLPVPPLPLPTRAEDRLRLRADLGLSAGQFGVALLADPPESGDAYRMNFLSSVLHSAGIRTVSVLGAGSARLTRATARPRVQIAGVPPIIVDSPLLPLLPAFDVVVMNAGARFAAPIPPATYSQRLMIATAHALGVPAITTDPGAMPEPMRGYAASESTHPASIARKVAHLAEHPGRWGEARAAAIECEKDASARVTQLLAALTTAWSGRSPADTPATPTPVTIPA